MILNNLYNLCKHVMPTRFSEKTLTEKEKQHRQKLKGIFFQEQIAGEKLINHVCLILAGISCIAFFLFITLMNIQQTNTPYYFIIAGLILFTVYHCALFYLHKKNIYRSYYMYTTLIINIVSISLIILDCTISYGSSILLQSPTMIIYFIIITLSAFYRNAFMPILSAIMITLMYTLFFIIATTPLNTYITSIHPHQSPPILYHRLLTYIIVFFIIGFLNAYLSKRFGNIIKQMLHSQSEAFELRKEKTAIEKNAQLKTELFVNIAHETKTPLTLISNYLDHYIQKVGFSDEMIFIKQNLDKLKRDMINFLDAEKLQMGREIYHHSQILNFSTILETQIILFKSLAANKRITITSNIESNIYIKAEHMAIERIINNLLDNAIKYSKQNDVINISLISANGTIIFTVNDSGTGFSPQLLNHISPLFYQKSFKKINSQKNGLGIYIVKKIIDSLNGSIKVKSSPGIGSRFTVMLNQYFISEKHEIDPPLDTIVQDDRLPLFNNMNTGINLQEKEPDARKNTILIVEDNIYLLSYIKTMLEQKYNVLCALNGKQAISRLKLITKPDLIISDIIMDEMDGHTFFYKVSHDNKYKDIPFIFLTAKTTHDEKIKGLSDGAIDYIYKPFSINELQTKIQSIIRNQKLKKALFEKDKFATLGKLTSGICHEISNPLGLIYGPLDLLEMEFERLDITVSNDIPLYLNRIANNVKRIEKIINSVKLFNYQRDLKKETIDLTNIFDAIIEVYQNKTQKNITISSHIKPEVSIIGDKEALSHILLNLVSNAVDAIKDTGTIHINADKQNGKNIIMVKDSGIGIPKDKLAYIYNAFYTEKDIGKGTGIGLYIVKDLIDKSGWQINVASTPGTGTAFTITT